MITQKKVTIDGFEKRSRSRLAQSRRGGARQRRARTKPKRRSRSTV